MSAYVAQKVTGLTVGQHEALRVCMRHHHISPGAANSKCRGIVNRDDLTRLLDLGYIDGVDGRVVVTTAGRQALLRWTREVAK